MVMILPTGGIFNCDTAEKIQTKGFLLNQLLMLLNLFFVLVIIFPVSKVLDDPWKRAGCYQANSKEWMICK